MSQPGHRGTSSRRRGTPRRASSIAAKGTRGAPPLAGTIARVPEGIPKTDLRRLNLGSGRRRDPTAINLDITPDTGPDVVHDLDVLPWPFPDRHFDHVDAIDVIEHLRDPLAVVVEIHRITRPGG